MLHGDGEQGQGAGRYVAAPERNQRGRSHVIADGGLKQVLARARLPGLRRSTSPEPFLVCVPCGDHGMVRGRSHYRTAATNGSHFWPRFSRNVGPTHFPKIVKTSAVVVEFSHAESGAQGNPSATTWASQRTLATWGAWRRCATSVLKRQLELEAPGQTVAFILRWLRLLPFELAFGLRKICQPLGEFHDILGGDVGGCSSHLRVVEGVSPEAPLSCARLVLLARMPKIYNVSTSERAAVSTFIDSTQRDWWSGLRRKRSRAWLLSARLNTFSRQVRSAASYLTDALRRIALGGGSCKRPLRSISRA